MFEGSTLSRRQRVHLVNFGGVLERALVVVVECHWHRWGAWRRNTSFLDDLVPFQRMVARLGMVNALAQTLVKLTAPGVPDVYQGQESWDFSLVDPDNRQLILARGTVICLDALPETIHNRLTAAAGGREPERPLLAGSEPLERIRAIKRSRERYYSVAHATIPTDHLTMEQVATSVVEAWKALSGTTGDGHERGLRT